MADCSSVLRPQRSAHRGLSSRRMLADQRLDRRRWRSTTPTSSRPTSTRSPCRQLGTAGRRGQHRRRDSSRSSTRAPTGRWGTSPRCPSAWSPSVSRSTPISLGRLQLSDAIHIVDGRERSVGVMARRTGPSFDEPTDVAFAGGKASSPSPVRTRSGSTTVSDLDAAPTVVPDLQPQAACARLVSLDGQSASTSWRCTPGTARRSSRRRRSSAG